MRVFAYVDRLLDACAYRKRFEQGLEPDASPYGFHQAAELGYDVQFSVAAGQSGLADYAHRLAKRVFGFEILHAIKNRGGLNACDIIWTMSEQEWLAAALLQALGVVAKKPIIANSIWLFDDWSTVGPLRRALRRRLALVPHALTVHSLGSKAVADRVLPRRVKTQLLYFGIPLLTFPIVEPRAPLDEPGPIRILAVGSDRSRDWTTLLSAVGDDPRFQVRVICRWLPKSLDRKYSNITVERTIAPFGYGAIYSDVDVAIIPLRENTYSGITVLLEAVAAGTPVVSSRTGGCTTYFGDDEVTFVPPGDVAALRNALVDASPAQREAKARRAQTTFIARDYSTTGMIQRYAAHAEAILRLERRKRSRRDR